MDHDMNITLEISKILTFIHEKSKEHNVDFDKYNKDLTDQLRNLLKLSLENRH